MGRSQSDCWSISETGSGDEDVGFPVYKAARYDTKQLGYYDYVTGGSRRDGKIEGGGENMGAGLCGGLFDRGNCVAAIVYPSNNPGCGGGGS